MTTGPDRPQTTDDEPAAAEPAILGPSSTHARANGGTPAPTPVFGSFVLSYLLGAALIVALVVSAGTWNVLANT